ncbi:MAG TPA: TMEM14 family protein [Polyangia bacterium]|jgi:uncharacterized membrane protein (UPF0136 family)
MVMPTAAALVTAAFGVLTLVGGILGFTRAGSAPSLIAGLVFGVVLLVAAWATWQQRLYGPILALIASGLLLMRFLPAYLRTHARWPALPMVILALATAALCLYLVASGRGVHKTVGPDGSGGPLLPG